MTAVIAPAPRYDALVEEAIGLIVAHAPEWTNHNPSDPGITIVELMAYYTEILSYRAARVTPDAKLNFLRLLEGASVSTPEVRIGRPTRTIEDAIRHHIDELGRIETAVTAADFERMAIDAFGRESGMTQRVHARCLPTAQFASAGRAPVNPADVTVILAVEGGAEPAAMAAHCEAVARELEPACLLTTHVQVVAASFLDVEIGARLMPNPGSSLEAAVADAQASIAERLDPWRAAAGGPFGRSLHVATVAAAIDRAERVDYVEAVSVERMTSGDTDGAAGPVGMRIGRHARPGADAWLGGQASAPMRRLETDASGEAIAVHAAPWEIIRVTLAPDLVERAVDHV